MRISALIAFLPALAAAPCLAAPGVPPAMPRTCETVAVLAAQRAGTDTAGSTARPMAGLFEEELDPEGRFLLRWQARGPGREAPQGAVVDVARTLDAAWRILVRSGAWPDPSREGPVEFNLVAVYGASRTVPLADPALSPEEAVPSAVTVHGPPVAWASEALHQLIHVLQLARSAREGLWAYEAGALALEDRLLGGGTLPAGLLARIQGAPERSLTAVDPARPGEAAAFLTWLAATRGESLLALWWDWAGREWGDNSLAALDTALRLTEVTPLSEAWRAWTVWSAVPDPSRRPAVSVAALAAALPPARAERVVSELPAEGLGGGAMRLEPLGYGVIRLQDLDAVGAVRIELESESGPVTADALVSWPDAEGGWLVSPLEFEDGLAGLGIPVAAGTEVALVVRNGHRDGGPVSVSWRVDADPSFPFELSDLAAEAAPGRIDLIWGSASERGLFGWLVYRADSPQGPFRPLSAFPLPALGESDGPLSYHWADSTVTPGRLYYYLVEGITVDGLARRSPVVTRRARPTDSGL